MAVGGAIFYYALLLLIMSALFFPMASQLCLARQLVKSHVKETMMIFLLLLNISDVQQRDADGTADPDGCY